MRSAFVQPSSGQKTLSAFETETGNVGEEEEEGDAMSGSPAFLGPEDLVGIRDRNGKCGRRGGGRRFLRKGFGFRCARRGSAALRRCLRPVYLRRTVLFVRDIFRDALVRVPDHGVLSPRSLELFRVCEKLFDFADRSEERVGKE